MKTFRRIANIILALYSAIGIMALIIVVITTFLQVITRYLLPKAPVWTEEGARYAFLWMSMMGASLAARHGSNASIDLLEALFKGKVKKIHYILLQLLILLAVILIIPNGIRMVSQMMMRKSPAIGVPMGYMYLAIPIGCIGIAIQITCNIMETVFDLKLAENGEG